MGDCSRLNIKEYFPCVSANVRRSILNGIKQNKEHIKLSHKINGRWENQYLGYQFVPQIIDIFRLACKAGKALAGRSVIIPYQGLGLSVDEYWFNVTLPYESTGWHDHKNNAILSGVYYLKVPSNSGDICFRQKINKSWDEFSIRSETGKMVIFDSNIQHSVSRNKSDDKRISLAFNMYSYPLSLDFSSWNNEFN